MIEPKEIQRVMAIARAHARDALTKHDTQRESYLAYCRNNWKRYATGISRSKSECERFAAALDRATRDLIALAEAAPDEEAAAAILHAEPSPWQETVEGAMDSVITHEAHQEPSFEPEPIRVTPDEVIQAQPEFTPLEIGTSPELPARLTAEAEDRLNARYSFRSPAEMDPPEPEVAPPEHAKELQRKVREVLLAHRPKSGA